MYVRRPLTPVSKLKTLLKFALHDLVILYLFLCRKKLWEIKKLKKEEATTSINSKKYQQKPPSPPPYTPQKKSFTNNVNTHPLIITSSSCKLLENFTRSNCKSSNSFLMQEA